MDGEAEAQGDDGARMIALPRRPPPLFGEPSARPPAVVIEFPAREAGPPTRDGGTPPRLAI